MYVLLTIKWPQVIRLHIRINPYHKLIVGINMENYGFRKSWKATLL